MQRIVIYSDLLLEPFMHSNGVEYIYSENYASPRLEGCVVIFLFVSDYRLYLKSNLDRMKSMILEVSKNNKVYVFADMAPELNLSADDVINCYSGISLKGIDYMLGSYAQMPFDSRSLQILKQKVEQIVWSNTEGAVKAIFLDLDNTLIPGVWEEDKDFIRNTYSDSKHVHYHTLLRLVKFLSEKGSQVIVCSKNDLSSVEKALEFIDAEYRNYITHVDAGWSSKAGRLEKILARMNISARNTIFIDDNLVEVESVRSNIPDMDVFHYQPTNSFFHQIMHSKQLNLYGSNSEDNDLRKEFYTKQLENIDND